MSRTTIKQLCREVADEVGLSRPDTLFAPYNEGDTSDAKLRRALTKTARFVHRYWDWPQCRARRQIVVERNGPQGDALPTDFARMCKGTSWRPAIVDMTGRRPVTMADAPPLPWQGNVTTSPVCVIRGGVLEYYAPQMGGVLPSATATPFPPPRTTTPMPPLQLPPEGSKSGAAVILFEYVRSVICEGREVAQAPIIQKPAFTHDDDTCLFDAELMHLGMVWALLHRDGAQTNEDYEAFKIALHEAMNHDSGDAILDLGASAQSDDPALSWGQALPLSNMPTTPWGQ